MGVHVIVLFIVVLRPPMGAVDAALSALQWGENGKAMAGGQCALFDNRTLKLLIIFKVNKDLRLSD
ncbi:hypothetical protein F7R01_22855 [Pseudomonas argentinensis]|uniref:hypothetical protein n=1 Tax=Phytopseudomonas argentinensis TaxID=289370 RepID=UPI001113756A|nr:hypothetical protein [Pseudomonas argentinensis]KAB0546279.1 hypothetical protein F7R01_22855 [Pseudomonas argentinensis]